MSGSRPKDPSCSGREYLTSRCKQQQQQQPNPLKRDPGENLMISGPDPLWKRVQALLKEDSTDPRHRKQCPIKGAVKQKELKGCSSSRQRYAEQPDDVRASKDSQGTCVSSGLLTTSDGAVFRYPSPSSSPALNRVSKADSSDEDALVQTELTIAKQKLVLSKILSLLLQHFTFCTLEI